MDVTHSLSQDLETGCPNRGFIDVWVSKVHTTNEINPKYLQILLFDFFRPVTVFFVLYG